MYYADVALFGRQETSNRAIAELTRYLSVPRHELHVINTPRSLFSGDIVVTVRGIELNGSVELDARGVQVPPFIFDDSASLSLKNPEVSLNFILVVEKETIFFRLLESGFVQSHSPCLLICGRGVPDLPSRKLLNLALEASGEDTPVFALVDHDPSGVNIGLVYATGGSSQALMQGSLHQKTGSRASTMTWFGSESLACPSCRPLFLPPSPPSGGLSSYAPLPWGITESELKGLSEGDRTKVENAICRLETAIAAVAEETPLTNTSQETRIKDGAVPHGHEAEALLAAARTTWLRTLQEWLQLAVLLRDGGVKFEVDAFKDLAGAVGGMILRAGGGE